MILSHQSDSFLLYFWLLLSWDLITSFICYLAGGVGERYEKIQFSVNSPFNYFGVCEQRIQDGNHLNRRPFELLLHFLMVVMVTTCAHASPLFSQASCEKITVG